MVSVGGVDCTKIFHNLGNQISQMFGRYNNTLPSITYSIVKEETTRRRNCKFVFEKNVNCVLSAITWTEEIPVRFRMNTICIDTKHLS